MSIATPEPQSSAEGVPPPSRSGSGPEQLLAPLRQVQRGIRGYIVAEGLAWAALGAAGWCLLSFLIDAGLLRGLLGVDYLRDGLVDGHRAARLLLWAGLWGGLASVLIYHLVYRLRTPFDLGSVAVVLERRFPKQLGDRLITALDFADPNRASRQQVSWPLVAVAAREAGERLEQLPLQELFNRQRLRVRIGAAVSGWLILLGLGVLFTDALAVWADRNLWLRDVYWPRPIIIEVQDFDSKLTKAVPYGSELPLRLRAWKWVVATTENPEGWRPLEWLRDLLPAEIPNRAWELAEPTANPLLYAALPPTWQKLTLDEIDARIETAALFEPYRREVGLAAAHYLASSLDQGVSVERLRPLLPSPWRSLSSAHLRDHLDFARRFTPADAKALLARWQQVRPVEGDLALALMGIQGSPLVPLLPLTWLSRRAEEAGQTPTPLAIPLAELQSLPASWRELKLPELRARIEQAANSFAAETLADQVRGELLNLFQELQRRVDLPHVGRRRTFRRLEVPARIALEFEQILEGEDRLRLRPKRGKPELRRRDGSVEFPYEFKKIEQPLRFRVVAGAGTTLWHRIEVRALPSLKRFERWHDEPGYLHESLVRVQVGPLPLALDGEESRLDVPVGSRIRIEGESYKPLAAVRLSAAGALDPSAGEVVHVPGSPRFELLLPTLTASERRLRLELEDGDGIVLGRRLLLIGQADKEPDFPRISFDVVSRKMITPQALLPLSAVIRDDHGLTAAGYEFTVEQPNRTVVARGFVPLRQFEAVAAVRPGTGLRFEVVTDVRLARLLTDWPGDPFNLWPALLRLPLTGPLGLALPPRFESVREFACAYEDRNLYGPVLAPSDEFLDTLLLRPQAGKALNEPILAPPYRLLIRVVAYDNRTADVGRLVPAPQAGRTNEVFEFQVVSEQELLIEVGKREEELRDRCEEVAASLRELRQRLAQLQQDLGTMTAADARAAASLVQQLQRQVPTARTNLDVRVLREFRQAYRELALNRCAAPVLDRINLKICLPLAELVQSESAFPAASDALERLGRRLEAEQEKLPPAVFAEAIVPLDRILANLDAIMSEMKKLIEFNQALQRLREIIKDLETNLQRLEQKRKEQQRRELEDK
jgi:prefoldin subunit 5